MKKHIKNDCDTFVKDIQTTAHLGVDLDNGVYKSRIANTDKNSGKSAGYRLISYLKLVDGKLYLMYIYDKSDVESISEKEIDTLVKKVIDEYRW